MYQTVCLATSSLPHSSREIFCHADRPIRRIQALLLTLRLGNERLAKLVRTLRVLLHHVDSDVLHCVKEIMLICTSATRLIFRMDAVAYRHLQDAVSSIRGEILRMNCLQSLEITGNPVFFSSDAIDILRSCPRLRKLTITLSPSPGNLTGHSYIENTRTIAQRTFIYLQELCYDRAHGNIPSTADLSLLSQISLPNLRTFVSSIGDECGSHDALTKCLNAWAPMLTRLVLTSRQLKPGAGILDAVLPNLTALIDLESNSKIFSLAALCRSQTIQQLSLCHWFDFEVEQLCRLLLENQSASSSPRQFAVLPVLCTIASCKRDAEIESELDHVSRERKIGRTVHLLSQSRCVGH